MNIQKQEIDSYKTWTIKYETYNNDVKVVEIVAYDKQSAISKLVNCKEIYWAKSITQQ